MNLIISYDISKADQNRWGMIQTLFLSEWKNYCDYRHNWKILNLQYINNYVVILNEHGSSHIIPSDFAKNFLADRCIPSLSGFTRLFSSIRLTRFSNPLKRPVYSRWQTWPRSLEIDTDFEITLPPTDDYGRELRTELIHLIDRAAIMRSRFGNGLIGLLSE